MNTQTPIYSKSHFVSEIAPSFPCELWCLNWGWVYFEKWTEAKTPLESYWRDWRAPTGNADVSAYPGEKHPWHNPEKGMHCSYRATLPAWEQYFDPLDHLLPAWWHKKQLPFWFRLIPKSLVSFRFWIIKTLKTDLYLAHVERMKA